MRKLNQSGASTAIVATLVALVLLWIGTGIFAITAYRGEQDYKNNVQPKIDTAVAIAKKDTETAKDKEFTEKEKNPLKTYTGPNAFGSVTVQFPKTWSAYVNETANSSQPVDGYFHPGFVPATNVITNAFALRLQVVRSSYDQQLKQFDSLVRAGSVRVAAYSLPKNPGIVGARVDGAIITNKQGSLILMPLRDTTVKVWTESNQYTADFNNIILPNLSFSP